MHTSCLTHSLLLINVSISSQSQWTQVYLSLFFNFWAMKLEKIFVKWFCRFVNLNLFDIKDVMSCLMFSSLIEQITTFWDGGSSDKGLLYWNIHLCWQIKVLTKGFSRSLHDVRWTQSSSVSKEDTFVAVNWVKGLCFVVMKRTDMNIVLRKTI